MKKKRKRKKQRGSGRGCVIWTAVKSQICCTTRNGIGQKFQECCLCSRVGKSAPIPAQNVQLFLPCRCCFFSRLSRHLARRVCLSPSRVYLSLFRVPLSLSRPSSLSLSWQSYVVGVVIWKSNPQVTSSVNARQQQTNNQITERKINSTVLMCVCVYSSYCGARSNQSVNLHPSSQEIAASLRSSNQRCNLIQLIHSFCLFFFRFSPQ